MKENIVEQSIKSKRGKMILASLGVILGSQDVYLLTEEEHLIINESLKADHLKDISPETVIKIIKFLEGNTEEESI